MASAYARANQNTVREYRLAGGAWPAKASDIAEWAIANNKWKISSASVLRACAADMSAAMAEEYITDDEGNRVRLKHVARMRVNGEQGSFWGDIRTMSEEHMQLSVSFRRRGIVAECKQLSNDVRYCNKERGFSIQLVLDFTEDVRELDQRRDRAA